MSIKPEKIFPCKLFDPSDKIPDFQIETVTRKALCFREDLIVCLKDELTSNTKPLGGYCVSLESIGPKGMEFMVQVLSSFTVNDSFVGTKLLSSITSKLHCLEEKRREYKHHEDGLNEKTLYIGLEDDLYHLEGEDLCPCDKTKWQKDLPLCSSSEMISEGANVLLMRYLAIKNFHGSLSFKSVMIGGQLTTCNYRCSEAQSMKFNDHIVDVYTIERRIHEECGLVHNTKTHLTRSGYILKHDWLDVPYLLEINSLIDPNEIDQRKRPKVVASLRSQWNSDIQLMSMYLDKKTGEITQQSQYLTEHPEIKQLISDYTQRLLAGNQFTTTSALLPSLLLEPINVLSFTIQHFAAFAKDPDPSEIGDSDESNLDIMSQLSKRKPSRICSVCGICFDCLISNKLKPNTECEHGARISRHPLQGLKSSELSLCSVFSKCPSNATCVKKLSDYSSATVSCLDDCKGCKNKGKKDNSRCSFYPECEKTCEGCKNNGKEDSLCSFHPECDRTCKGCENNKKKDNSLCTFHLECDKTCEGCKNNGKRDNSLCSFHLECGETCKGCKNHKKKFHSLCSFHPECNKTCKGCKNNQKKDSLCSFHPECDEICKGCKNIRKKGNSFCSFYPECEKTCEGCEKDGKLNNSLCSLHPECVETCEGCRSFKKPCPIHKVCPECPGCHQVCSEIAVCPNCTKCNIEILPNV